MIKIVKQSICSFHLIIDRYGAEELLSYIKNLRSNKKEKLNVLYPKVYKNFEIELDNEKDILLIEKDCVKIFMDDEEIKYFEHRLIEASASGNFYPSEICERIYKDKYATIYCKIIYGPYYI